MRVRDHQRSIEPRGLRAEHAAAYLGMSKTKFLELVNAEIMPRPVQIEGIKVWDRRDLDEAFDEFKGDPPGRENSWDKILSLKK